MSPRERCWSKSVGERGHRVRVYEQRPGGPLYRSVYDPETGKEERKSLRHRDRALAVQQAYERVAERMANHGSVRTDPITLRTLEKMYLASPAFEAKKLTTRRQDARNLERIIGFLGPDRIVASLSESDVQGYAVARRRGDEYLVGIRPGVPVSDRTVQADLVTLATAINWGTRDRDASGQRRFAENPLDGIPFPREKNPRRPVMSNSTFESLLSVSANVTELLRVFLIVAEGTGARVSAVCGLSWSDVDLDRGTIRWRAENDKTNRERVVPMASNVEEVLREYESRRTSIGDTPVFPSPKDPAKPCSRHLLDSWLRKAYELADLPRKEGGLWHPIRRKWVTERKGHPTADLAAAGGWEDEETMVRSYQSADPETIRLVVETRTHIFEAAEG
jgi:integrase